MYNIVSVLNRLKSHRSHECPEGAAVSLKDVLDRISECALDSCLPPYLHNKLLNASLSISSIYSIYFSTIIQGCTALSLCTLVWLQLKLNNVLIFTGDSDLTEYNSVDLSINGQEFRGLNKSDNYA